MKDCDLEKVFQFLREVRSELKKVVWPNRQQVVASTIVVMAMVLIVGLFVAGVDLALDFVAKRIGI